MPDFPLFLDGQLLFCNGGLATVCCDCDPIDIPLSVDGPVEGGGYLIDVLHEIGTYGPWPCVYAIFYSGSADDSIVIHSGGEIIFEHAGFANLQGYPWVERYLCQVPAGQSITLSVRNLVGGWCIHGTLSLMPIPEDT